MNWKPVAIIFAILVLVVLALYATRMPASAPSPEAPATSTPQAGEENERMEVVFYAYDAARDTDAQGNVLCSAAGLVPITRSIQETPAPLGEALALLFAGSLTAEERARGLTTEFPLAGVTLDSVSVENGTAVISISDPQNSTSGGACRTGIMAMQITKTAQQFPTVTDVRLEPEEVFQP